LKEEELMALLEEIIIEIRKEVMWNSFFESRSHHKDWKGCGENFFPKSRLESSSFRRTVHQ
jgi:hypothetical protein